VVEGLYRSNRVVGMQLRASDGRELKVSIVDGEPAIPLIEPDPELVDEFRRWKDRDVSD
jgi:hypothetical protein